MHPTLESLVKEELNKLLGAKIILPVQHTYLFVNLIPIKKKNGDIHLCVDFRNLNKDSLKERYLLPPMEQIL